MQGKGIVKFFLIVMTVVCLVQFLFMWPTSVVENDAEEYAQEQAEGIQNEFKREEVLKSARTAYLDSMSSEEIFSIPLLKSYTYQELKSQQLNLGLDLKGGMSVVLQVNLREFLLALSDYNKDPTFRKALNNTSERLKTEQADYISIFAEEWNQVSGDEKLARIFSRNASLREVINFESTDAEVINELRKRANETVKLTFKRLKERINKYGVTQPNVSLDDSRDLILVELPGVDNPERARNYLQASAELEFWEVFRVSDQGIIASFRAANDKLASMRKDDRKSDTSGLVGQPMPEIDTIPVLDSLGNETSEYTYDTISVDESPMQDDMEGPLLSLLNLNTVSGPQQNLGMPPAVMGTAEENKRDAINKMLNQEEIKKLFPANVKFLWSRNPAMNYQTGEETEMYELYAIKTIPGKRAAPLEGNHVVDANAQPDPVSGEVTVSLSMDQKGAQIWGDMTTEAAQDNNRPIAIVLDDEVVSAPNVNEPIKNGNSSISGNFSVQEGEDLANILKIGKLPAETTIIQESLVGPSLGQENINRSITSLLIGFSLVLLFMIAYYGGAGIISILSLLANIFFIFGTLSSYGTVLTLPGIAGIVLTIGMAVDANVIIYERIREELRQGKSMLIAIQDGFTYSYSAIIDANVTTILVAIILAYFGLGPIRGFAVVLIIGVLCTLLTAVLLTRLIVDWWLNKGRNISFWTGFSKNFFSDMQVDWMGKRRIAYTISGILILASVISITTKGWELGVDFKGGRSYDVQFAQDIDVDPDALRAELSQQFDGEPVVKAVDVHNKFNITTSYLISESSDSANNVVMDKLFAGVNNVVDKDLNKKLFESTGHDETHVSSSSKVGPTIADDIIQSSWEATVFALLLIFIYIFIRFSKWQYSLGSVMALFHDTIILLGFFSILAGIVPFSVEIDQAFIAALLTVIGYSINDTVIVFDRIREFLGKYTTRSKNEVINMAINSTFSRTVITSLTTFIVVAILFFFGGTSIKGFAFAIMVGIIVGTYSSIFIATPVVSELTDNLGASRKSKSSSKRKYSKT